MACYHDLADVRTLPLRLAGEVPPVTPELLVPLLVHGRSLLDLSDDIIGSQRSVEPYRQVPLFDWPGIDRTRRSSLYPDADSVSTQVGDVVEVVSTIVATGVVVDVLVLAAGGRRPEPRVRDVVSLGLWSLPGLLVGAVLLRELPSAALQLLVAAAVLYAVAHRIRPLRPRRRDDGTAAEHWWSPAPAGIASGVLSTSTTLGGPPVVLYLTRRPRSARETRDTLVALSLLRLPLSVAALLLTDAWVQPTSLPLLWVAVVLGYGIGRWVFTGMDLLRYERAVLAVLVVAALTAIAAALT